MKKESVRNYCQLAAMAAGLMLNAPASKGAMPAKANKATQPNIIFIVTDDQRWDMLGCAGNRIIRTPNIDRMASEGVRFTHAFVTTPICAASRASFLTGLYERTHGYTFTKPPVKQAYMDMSYPLLLRRAGYSTGFVGKFGVKVETPVDSLFDSFRESLYPYWKNIGGKRRHVTSIQEEDAIRFIREQHAGKPFCLSLSFSAPHADDAAKEQYFWTEAFDTLYQKATIPVPVTAAPSFYESLPDFLKGTMNRERWHWRFDTPEKFQSMVKGYYRMISELDQVVGKIREELNYLGQAGNTIIVLMGDNGYYLGDRGYADKWLMHDVSIRVPLVIYDPRKQQDAGKVLDQMVLNIDVPPTILEFAGIRPPGRLQGTSLMPLLNGSKTTWRKVVFCEHLWDNPQIPQSECIRTEEWKFIRYPKHPEYVELYNLNNDPWEEHNLANNAEYRRRIEQFQKQCDQKIRKLVAERSE